MSRAVIVCDPGFVPGGVGRMAPMGLGVPLAVVDAQPVNWFTPALSIVLHGG